MNLPYSLPGDSPEFRFEAREPLGWLPRGYIAGLILANDTTDATNDISISAGVCRSTVNIVGEGPSTLARDQLDLEIPVSVIKQLDVAWAPENYDPDGYSGGGRSGMLDPLASISNASWHVYVVGGNGQQADIMAIASATQATVLASIQAAGFTAYRRVGAVIRSGATILAFSQAGDEFLLYDPPFAQNGALGSTNAVSVTTTVPVGVKVQALVNLSLSNAADAIYLSSLDVLDEAPSSTTAPLATSKNNASFNATGPHRVRTNTSAQIRARISANNTVYITTLGWLDDRDRDA